MYRIATTTTQNREPQLRHASRNTNPHVSKSIGVNHTTSVSRPQLKCYQVKDKVVPNNSQVKFKKKEVEDHHRISSISKKTKSVTACNDSSNSRTSNVNAVCAECGKCVFNSNHDACVSRYLNDVNARTKKPNVVPISASKPKRKANKSVATPHKKTVASDTTIQKSKSYHKELYENTNQEWKWWIAKRCPSGYKWTQKPLRTKKIWMPKIKKEDVSTSISPTIDIISRITNIVQLILFIVDSGCTKHMTGNLKLLCNFVEKFLGTVRFGNDQTVFNFGNDQNSPYLVYVESDSKEIRTLRRQCLFCHGRSNQDGLSSVFTYYKSGKLVNKPLADDYKARVVMERTKRMKIRLILKQNTTCSLKLVWNKTELQEPYYELSNFLMTKGFTKADVERNKTALHLSSVESRLALSASCAQVSDETQLQDMASTTTNTVYCDTRQP
ncbi:hypothetical protein Tco_0417464 [Tanacetum coccineum]